MSETGRPGEPDPRTGVSGPVRRPAAMPQGMQGHPAASAGPGPDGTDDPAPAGGTSGRPAWLLPAAIGGAVLVVVAVVVGVLVNRGGAGESPTPAASTVVAPVPTPAVQPAARPATTAFASALPTSVLQYALESSQDDAEWIAAGALEAYAETLTDGSGGTVTVRAAQLETPQEATALLQQLAASLPAAPAPADPSAAPDPSASAAPEDAPEDAPADLPQTGEVTVAGAPVGTFSVVDAGDGTGVALWQNGTAVFRLTAPLAEVLDCYKAYGL